MKKVVGILIFAITVACAHDVLARPEFKKPFTDKYVAKHKSKEFQALAKKASCNVCHVKGAKKDVNNEYGKVLASLIEGRVKQRLDDAKKEGGLAAQKKMKAEILEELAKAFDKAAEAKSDKGQGPTYGELIKEGKLPVDVEKAAEAYKAEKKKQEQQEEEA